MQKVKTTDSVVSNPKTEKNGVLFTLLTCMWELLPSLYMTHLELIKPDLSLTKPNSQPWLAPSSTLRSYLNLKVLKKKTLLTQVKERWSHLLISFNSNQLSMKIRKQLLRRLELQFILINNLSTPEERILLISLSQRKMISSCSVIPQELLVIQKV